MLDLTMKYVTFFVLRESDENIHLVNRKRHEMLRTFCPLMVRKR
uniref:Uncharacterized protein n=1 Tax=Anguilla anguilla TaxID=7936 RepID=A0A0E9UIX6_ANGAN